METVNVFQTVQTILTIIGSLGLFKFIEFLIARSDKKEERREDKQDQLGELERKMEKRLEQRNEEAKAEFERSTAGLKAQAALEQQRYDEIKEVLIKNAEDDKERDIYIHTMGEALMGIIHDRIITNADVYIERDGITREELSTINSLYRPYKALGGNGDAETAYNLICTLDLISKQDANIRDLRLIENRYCNKV